MKILLVMAHPEPNSFNAAMYHTAIETLQQQGHEVQTSDLYAMHFNPVSDRHNFTVTKNNDFLKLQKEEMYATEVNGFEHDLNIEQEKVEWCDLMIWQFPMWWFGLPAILKGWVDRVFAMGRFYKNSQIYENGILTGKKAMLAVTTGGNSDAYQPGGLHGGVDNILKPIHRGIFQFLGFSILAPQLNYEVAHLTDDQRMIELNEWAERLKGIEQENGIHVDKY